MALMEILGGIVGLGIGGSKEKSSSSSTGTEEYSDIVKRLSEEDQAKLSELLATFTSQQKEGDVYTREAALKDVSGQVEGLFQKYRESTLPEILTMQQGTGGYAGTTAQRLSNQAYAQTVAEGTKLQTDAVKTYSDIMANIRQVGQQGIGAALQAMLQAEEEMSGTAKTTSSTSGRGSSFNWGAGVKGGG